MFAPSLTYAQVTIPQLYLYGAMDHECPPENVEAYMDQQKKNGYVIKSVRLRTLSLDSLHLSLSLSNTSR
jgi:hypothetical protein